VDIFDPVMLSRIQFGFVISFHIIFPAFTIGLAAWLAILEGLRYFTGKPIYGRLFDFWLRVFGVSFALGVVTGIVMAFQFGTNWGVLAEKTGSIQGPLSSTGCFAGKLIHGWRKKSKTKQPSRKPPAEYDVGFKHQSHFRLVS